MVSVILPGECDVTAAVRVRFHKRGALQYIAHLDLVRTVTKAVKRAGIPVRYSEGFNPHPRISFATAMSIGLESDYEFLDIRIDKPVDPARVKEAFNAAMPEECQADEVYFPTTKFTDIRYSSYHAEIRTAGVTDALAERCNAALHGTVVVFKRSKSGDKDTDVSACIKEVSVRAEDGKLILDATLTADNASFLNPEYLITFLKEKCAVLAGSPREESYTLLRTGLYTEDMTLFR